ncbi:MAG: XdhC family protein [Anaerolineaceae bacterium]|nr:XdhC family protein [Anaerolineaceae bacterium]
MDSIFLRIADLERKGDAIAVCTIVKGQGSSPRHVGSKMIVFPDGKIEGSVGGGTMESRVIKEAMEALNVGKSRILEYRLVDPAKGDVGVCGGQVEIYIEPLLPKPQVVILGGGHVGKAVAHLAHWLGFRVAISDDRHEFCSPEAIPDADEYYPVKMSELPQHLKITSQSYLVLTTRGKDIDIPGVPVLLDTPAPFIGIIGSKRRWLLTKKAMIENGVPEEKLSHIHSPIGLDIKAETPEEIAVSIMAEIIKIQKGGTGKSMKM